MLHDLHNYCVRYRKCWIIRQKEDMIRIFFYKNVSQAIGHYELSVHHFVNS